MNDEITPEIAEATRAYFAALAAGVCHECGAKVEEQKQIGRCVYALPCYHRMFQGTASGKARPRKIHPFLLEQEERERKLQEGHPN